MKPGGTVAEQSAATNRIRGALRRGWVDRPHGRPKRKWRPALKAYMWARERGPLTGALHMHALMEMGSVNYTALRRLAVRCGFGRNTDIRPIKNQQRVKDYVVKYATKSRQSASRHRFPRYTRVVQSSRMSALPPPDCNWDVRLHRYPRRRVAPNCLVLSAVRYRANHARATCVCRECLEFQVERHLDGRFEREYEPLGARSARSLGFRRKKSTNFPSDVCLATRAPPFTLCTGPAFAVDFVSGKGT